MLDCLHRQGQSHRNAQMGLHLQTDVYPLKPAASAVAQMLGISFDSMIENAGLVSSQTGESPPYVTPSQFFRAWYAAEQLYGKPDIGLVIGKTIANAPPSPLFFSLMSAPNFSIGMQRMAQFKSLFGPIQSEIRETGETFTVIYKSTDPEAFFPPNMAIAHVVFSVLIMRNLTAAPIAPIAVQLSAKTPISTQLQSCLEVTIDRSPASSASVSYSQDDAQRPFLSASAELWTKIESQLYADFEAFEKRNSMTGRVRRLLLQKIPSGNISSKQIQNELKVSQSTLQRRLSEESTSFRQLLEDTKVEIATSYLENPSVNLAEISMMIGYSDPNSFFRFFKRLTGNTPSEYRRKLLE